MLTQEEFDALGNGEAAVLPDRLRQQPKEVATPEPILEEHVDPNPLGIQRVDPPKEDEEDLGAVLPHTPAGSSFAESQTATTEDVKYRMPGQDSWRTAPVNQDKPETFTDKLSNVWSEARQGWEAGALPGSIMGAIRGVLDEFVVENQSVQMLEKAAYPVADAMLGVAYSMLGLFGGVASFIPTDKAQNMANDIKAMQVDRLQDRSREIQRLFADGRSTEAIWRSASAAVGDIYGHLSTFKVFAQFAFGKNASIVTKEAGWTAAAQSQVGRAAMGYFYGVSNTIGSLDEKNKAGLMMFSYMLTPVWSSAAKTNVGAFVADFLSNTLLDLGYNPTTSQFSWPVSRNPETGKLELGGQYKQAVDDAKIEADAMGKPELFWQLAAAKMMPILGTSAGFSVLTRSARANNDLANAAMNQPRPPAHKMTETERVYYTELEQQSVKMGLNPEIAATKNSAYLNSIIDGTLSVSSQNKLHAMSAKALADEIDRQVIKPPKASTDAVSLSKPERTIPLADELRGLSERIDPTKDIPATIKDVLDAMPTREDAIVALHELANNTATAQGLRDLYDAKVSGGEIQRVGEGIASSGEIVASLADKWQPSQEKWTPERIAKIDTILPETARTQVISEFQASRPSQAQMAQNAYGIFDMIKQTASMGYGKTKKDGTLAPTHGNNLARGFLAGLTMLRDDPEFTGGNIEARLDYYEKNVPGFGPSSRQAVMAAWRSESPEDALRILNELRVADKKMPLQPSSIIAQGGVKPPEPFRLSVEDRESMMASLPRNIPDAIKNTVLDNVTHAPPRDPYAREVYVNALAFFAKQHEARQGSLDSNSIRASIAKIARISTLAQEQRYFMGNMAADLGDFKFYEATQRFDANARRAGYYIEMRLEEMFKLDGKKSDYKFIHWLSGRPEIESAIATIIGINPKTKSKAEIEALAKANATMSELGASDPVRRNKAIKLAEKIAQELQTFSATNTRYLQTDRFIRAWNKPTKGGRTLGQKYVDNASNPEALKSIMNSVESLLPWRWNEETQKAERVSVDTMLEAIRVFNESGKDGLMRHLLTENWGTRKYYWMSERESPLTVGDGPMSEGFNIDLLPGRLNESQPPSSINQRTGQVEIEQGSLIASLYKHMYRLETFVATLDDNRIISEKINKYSADGYIDRGAKEWLKEWRDNEIGKAVPPKGVAKWAMKANSFFWTAYFASVARTAFYSARNLLWQGTPHGVMTTQFKVGDIAQAYGDHLRAMRDPNSMVKHWTQREFAKDVSQKRAIWDQQILQRDPALRHYSALENRLGWGAAKSWLTRWAGTAAGFSDQGTRLTIGGMSFTVGERYVNRFISGEINYRDIERGLLLTTLRPEERMVLAQKFDDAIQSGKGRVGFYGWLSELAEIKNKNANFVYRLGGKSMVEQDAATRQFVGLINYPRGVMSMAYQNGFKPMARQMANLFDPAAKVDVREFADGFRTLAMMGVGMTISNAMADAIYGRRGDKDSYTFFDFSFLGRGGVGLGVLQGAETGLNEIYDAFVDYGWKDGLSVGSEKFSDATFWYFGIAKDIANMLQAGFGVEARSNIDAYKVLLDSIMGTETAKFKEIERKFYERWIKLPLFGYGERTKEEDEELIQHMIDQNFLKKLYDWSKEGE